MYLHGSSASQSAYDFTFSDRPGMAYSDVAGSMAPQPMFELRSAYTNDMPYKPWSTADDKPVSYTHWSTADNKPVPYTHWSTADNKPVPYTHWSTADNKPVSYTHLSKADNKPVSYTHWSTADDKPVSYTHWSKADDEPRATKPPPNTDQGLGAEWSMARPISHPIYNNRREEEEHPISCWPFSRPFFISHDLYSSFPQYMPESPVTYTSSESLSPVAYTSSGSLSPVAFTNPGPLSPVAYTSSESLSPVTYTSSGSLSPVAYINPGPLIYMAYTNPGPLPPMAYTSTGPGSPLPSTSGGSSLSTSPDSWTEETTGSSFATWPRNPGAVRGTSKAVNDILGDEQLFCTGHWTKYKTELCNYFEEVGFCKRGPFCSFAHGAHELRYRERGPNYKRKMCINYHTKPFVCLYGKRCVFIH